VTDIHDQKEVSFHSDVVQTPGQFHSWVSIISPYSLLIGEPHIEHIRPEF
jgi:hypothetical protein